MLYFNGCDVSLDVIPLSLSQTHAGGDVLWITIIPRLIFKLFSVEFLPPLFIPAHTASWLLSATTKGRIHTIYKNSMCRYGVLYLRCGCVNPAASVYAGSLITQFSRRHKRNVAAGERLELFYNEQVLHNWAHLTQSALPPRLHRIRNHGTVAFTFGLKEISGDGFGKSCNNKQIFVSSSEDVSYKRARKKKKKNNKKMSRVDKKWVVLCSTTAATEASRHADVAPLYSRACGTNYAPVLPVGRRPLPGHSSAAAVQPACCSLANSFQAP